VRNGRSRSAFKVLGFSLAGTAYLVIRFVAGVSACSEENPEWVWLV
jgi:hypothetical protein